MIEILVCFCAAKVAKIQHKAKAEFASGIYPAWGFEKVGRLDLGGFLLYSEDAAQRSTALRSAGHLENVSPELQPLGKPKYRTFSNAHVHSVSPNRS